MNSLAASGTDAGSVVATVFFIVVAIVAYWVPTIVALIRRSEIPNVGSIVVINLFAGWTLVGWVIALAMACRSSVRMAPPPAPPPPYRP